MPIEWKEKPAWGWGGGARPVGLSTLYSQIYTYYTSENQPIIEQMNYGGEVNAGWYRASVGGSSMTRRNTENFIAGYNPSAEISGAGSDYTITLMTILFPAAECRWTCRMTVSYQSQYQIYNISIGTKWFDLEGNDITGQISDAGFSVAPGWVTPWEWAGITRDPGRPCQFAVRAEYNGETELYGFTVSGTNRYDTAGGSFLQWGGGAILIDAKQFAAYLQERNPDLDFGVFEVEIESPEAGPASGPGGYGGYGGDITASDSIPVPALPSASAAALGFINMYNPTAGGLTGLGEEIFPDFEFTSIVDPTGNDIIDAILNACGAFVEVFNQIPTMFKMLINSRLIDYVQDCHIVPVQPVTGAAAHIKLGFRELDITAPTIPNEYVEVDLGSVSLEEFYHQFIDYLPYTRAKLYLPFIGFVPVEPEYWQDGSIGVTYHFNVYDGSFMAYVTSSPNDRVSEMRDSVIGQYAGTAVVHLPLTGLNYSSMVAGLVGGVGGAIAAIGSGNVAAGLSAAINTATSSPQVMSSNGYTASAAFFSCRYPFLIIERSVSHFPANYQHDVGMPSKISTKLGSASGFVTVGDVDLTSVHAKQSEIAEIRSLLANGIYV